MEGLRSTGFFKKSELNQHRDEKNRHSGMNSTENRRVVAKGLGRGRNGEVKGFRCFNYAR